MDVERYEELLPAVTEANLPYWEGCRKRELRLQACRECGDYRFPDGPVCSRCLSSSYEWRRMSGRGTLWSWIVMHQRYFEAFADEVPYIVAFVRLEEGPFMISTVIEPPGELWIDARVEVVFELVGKERVIPKFRVVGGWPR